MPAAVGTARYTRRDTGLYVRDGFDRADHTTSLVRAETGQQWTTFGSGGGSATWGTLGGQAYLAAASGGTDYGCYIDTGLRGGIVEAVLTFTGTGNSMGVLLRWQDDTNYLGVRLLQSSNRAEIIQNVAGTRSFPTNGAVTLTAGVPYRVRIVYFGPRIVCLVNGAHLFTASNTNFLGATKQGLIGSNSASTGRTWNDYSMRAA